MAKKREENLVPLNLSHEEAVKNGKKGGKASVESRRQRKALKDNMNFLLNLPITNSKDYNKVANMGIPIEDIDNSQLIVLALFRKACDGDVNAFKELRDLVGETGEKTDLNALEKARELLGGVKSAF